MVDIFLVWPVFFMFHFQSYILWLYPVLVSVCPCIIYIGFCYTIKYYYLLRFCWKIAYQIQLNLKFFYKEKKENRNLPSVLLCQMFFYSQCSQCLMAVLFSGNRILDLCYCRFILTLVLLSQDVASADLPDIVGLRRKKYCRYKYVMTIVS